MEKYLLCPQPSVLYDLWGYGPQIETIISHRHRILFELTLYIQFRLNYKINWSTSTLCAKTKKMWKYIPAILGCSYRASSVRIAIRLPTDATVYFVENLFSLFLPYMFRTLISPSSGVSQAVFYIQPFGSCGVYVAHLPVPVDGFVVVVSLYWSPRQTSPQAHADEQHKKHHMNQMVVYKNSLRYP